MHRSYHCDKNVLDQLVRGYFISPGPVLIHQPLDEIIVLLIAPNCPLRLCFSEGSLARLQIWAHKLSGSLTHLHDILDLGTEVFSGPVQPRVILLPYDSRRFQSGIEILQRKAHVGILACCRQPQGNIVLVWARQGCSVPDLSSDELHVGPLL